MYRELCRAYVDNLQTKLLLEFPLDGMKIVLSRGNLPAGKFPQPAVALFRRPLAEQNGPVSFDD
jgi:hypothetical protein